jgi:hypothetical protein
MAILKLVQYHVHSVSLNGTAVGGVQTVNVSRNFDNTTIIKMGDPSVVKNFYKKPTVEVSFSKFLSNGVGPSFPGFNLTSSPPQTASLSIGISGGGGLSFADMVVGSASYTFNTEGFFTEQLTFTGHVMGASAAPFVGFNEEGIVKRRQDFILSGFPQEVSALLSSGHVLLSAEASFNANYNFVPTYGNFYTIKGKYLSYPVDVSCSFEILDRGYTHTSVADAIAGSIDDTVQNRSIVISAGGVTINLGSENFLVGLERTGGDAGQSSSYSTYRYTYKNNNGSFTVS